MTRLVPLSPVHAWERISASAGRYAQELVGTGMAPEDAAAGARAALARLLPDGVATPGHRFASIAGDGGLVGYVWWGRHPAWPADAYVYDLAVDPGHRRRGHGGAALREVAAAAAAEGAARLGLRVFESNTGAARLYERLGFVTARAADGRREIWLPLPDPVAPEDVQPPSPPPRGSPRATGT